MTSDTTSSAMPPAAQEGKDIVQLLHLDPISDKRFVTRYCEPNRTHGLFGGQILGQGLVAAANTVSRVRLPSEVRIIFLLPGSGAEPVEYEVEILLEGGSFSVRRVRALQGARLIADLTASFHKPEQGFEHQDSFPANVPPPEDLLSLPDLVEKYRDQLSPVARASLGSHKPVELRPVAPEQYLMGAAQQPECWYWMRAQGRLPDDAGVHYATLAYMSDWWFSVSGIISHVAAPVGPTLFVTSLNHNLWLHRPCRSDEWLLFRTRSPSATGGRGLCFGEVWDRQGRRVASVAQEALYRQRLAKHPDPAAH